MLVSIFSLFYDLLLCSVVALEKIGFIGGGGGRRSMFLKEGESEGCTSKPYSLTGYYSLVFWLE